jgi:hypothetical protein
VSGAQWGAVAVLGIVPVLVIVASSISAVKWMFHHSPMMERWQSFGREARR